MRWWSSPTASCSSRAPPRRSARAPGRPASRRLSCGSSVRWIAETMRAVLTVFVKEFRENLRERRTLLSALILGPLLGPLLLAGGLTLRLERGVGESERAVPLAVAHGDRAPNLLIFLREHGVSVTPVDYDEAAARAAVRSGRVQQVLAVDKDFAERLATGAPAPLELYADASDLTGSGD